MTEPIRRVTPEFAELYPEHAKFFGLSAERVSAIQNFVKSLEASTTNGFGAKIGICGAIYYELVLKHLGITSSFLAIEKNAMIDNAIEYGTCLETTT